MPPAHFPKPCKGPDWSLWLILAAGLMFDTPVIGQNFLIFM